MRRAEHGSEAIQAVVAVPLILMVVFSIVQVGATMLTIDRLSADLGRACNQLDVGGLGLAEDKEAFVRMEVLGSATQLLPDRLQVDNVVFANSSRNKSVEGRRSNGLVSQRTDAADVSFDVSYEIPVVFELPGLSHRVIARHVECRRVEGRIVEVEVGKL